MHSQEKVMSPSGKVTAAGEHRAQPKAKSDHESTSSLQEEIGKFKEEPRDTQSKLLDLLTELTDCMERMEASQE
uniref:AlNc14C282G10125 protein n=1 Tax=Albugo laibachii Nc14 TaxID=890382 RepID=F0WUX8_9STRA|nr:AlNc14C282G10125 [Albugo laibachii Nc14]|eukprot:CCA25214.1 AlNc14C282G10125 [Albugo laibachii Nc14]